jgi:hypothetical protein
MPPKPRKKPRLEEEAGVDEEEGAEILKTMGFSNFDSSKGKDHSQSDCSFVKKISKRKYRQFIQKK